SGLPWTGVKPLRSPLVGRAGAIAALARWRVIAAHRQVLASPHAAIGEVNGIAILASSVMG
ncbi:hypothetical protein, partial [Xanthomonas arboricola]|uniref:hypothetical protein n=1 Tax=Xanthomonas arboricola TaxID=56448 RepID=UPI001C12C2A6